jgi:tartrate-resistant acid phosphatase type 5
VKFSLRSWCFLLIAASIAVIFLSTAVLKGNARPSQLLNLQDSRNPFLADSSPEKQDVNWGREVVGTQTNFQFAVIGDYGSGSAAESDVADLVRSWSPDFILTTGDNNYNNGSADTIDENIGKFYHEFIYPYYGSYGEGAQVNRFFPSLGNHDWRTPGAQPYLDYFSLPGNERYYDFTWGLVVFHHAPYSSGDHGSNSWMQKWKFAEWGADVVLSGHDHTYERIAPPADILYFVNGLGGKSIYAFPDLVEGSQIRYNGDYGAMLVDVSFGGIRFRFINRQGETIDDFSLVKPLTNFYLPSIQKSVP